MALIKCTECGLDLSDKAAACPGCGAPIDSAQPSPRMSRGLTSLETAAIVVAAAAAMAAIGFKWGHLL